MTERPVIGEQVLCRRVPEGAFERYSARPVRTLEDYQKMAAIRAAVFMSEQDCPYEEEFDGNDLCATHFLVFDGPQPVGTLRMRWFAGFAKLERVVLLRSQRGRPALQVMLAEAFELAARKGYEMMIAQIQARLWPVWSRTFKCRIVPGRPCFWFSDYEYIEIEIPVPHHPQALSADEDPMVMIRPEGLWDKPGVLDASVGRSGQPDVAA
ncbi:MAG: N-acetyltransferase [Hyphomonas oceanitis]|uniref:GNAT family N-acetyltransferase n=1 Tax=Hyphomonas oceanitis TaxID=81033 RepID=UPI003002FABD